MRGCNHIARGDDRLHERGAGPGSGLLADASRARNALPARLPACAAPREEPRDAGSARRTSAAPPETKRGTSVEAPAYRPSHFGLCVSDLERSLRFYRDGLGFALAE